MICNFVIFIECVGSRASLSALSAENFRFQRFFLGSKLLIAAFSSHTHFIFHKKFYIFIPD